MAQVSGSPLSILSSLLEVGRSGVMKDEVRSRAGKEKLAVRISFGGMRSILHKATCAVTGCEETCDDVPLIDAGLVSIGTVEFRSRVAPQFPGVSLPFVTVFDHPTI